MLLAAPARAEEVPISKDAKRRFQEGIRYLRSQDPDRYEKAYREFKAAYTDSPSWKILGNLGIVAQELERDGEAIEAYRGYLEGGGKELSAEERKQFENDLLLLESGVTTVTLRTDPDGAWIVDERLPEVGDSVINRYGPTSGPLELRVRAGHHRIRAELSGHETESWEFSEAPGASVAHAFELRSIDARPEASAPEPQPIDRGPEPGGSSATMQALGYTALGLGAVGAGLGTWFFLDISDKEDEATAAHARCDEATPGMGICDDEPNSTLHRQALDAQDAEARTRTLSLLGFGAGGALLATGVILLIVGSEGDAPSDESASIRPWVGPRSLGVLGTF